MRRRRSPARPRPTRGVGALDLSFDEPTHVEQHISKLIVAVLSILSAVAAAHFIADATGSEVEMVDEYTCSNRSEF